MSSLDDLARRLRATAAEMDSSPKVAGARWYGFECLVLESLAVMVEAMAADEREARPIVLDAGEVVRHPEFRPR